VSDILLLAGAFGLGACVAAALLVPALRSARAAATRAEAQLAAAAREGSDAARRDAAIAAENAELRRRMDDLADAILATRPPVRPEDAPGG
jgi:hypothetical protein